MRILPLLLLALILTGGDAHPRVLTAQNAMATAMVATLDPVVYPDTPPLVRATVVVTDRIDLDVWAVVVIVHVTSPIDATVLAGAGACEQESDPRSGRADWLVCRFFEVPPGSSLVVEARLRPRHIVVDPISAACLRPPMQLGIPVSVAVNGSELIAQSFVWAPYRAGYCAYLPSLHH